MDIPPGTTRSEVPQSLPRPGLANTTFSIP
jgi:hypothetical protein